MMYTCYLYPDTTECIGLDMRATGTRIGKMINASGLNDKQLSGRMNLSVQAINKWRHGHGIPDIENMFILSRILGKRVDDFLVPLVVSSAIEVDVELIQDLSTIFGRLNAYSTTR